MRCAQHLEDPVQTLLADHVAHADDLGVLSGDEHRKVTLRYLQNEVDLLLALDGALLDCLDLGRAVMRVNNGLADLERHMRQPLSIFSGYHGRRTFFRP